MRPDEIVNFWMAAGPTRWFTRDAAFDGALAVRFGAALREARLGALDHWSATPEGALGLVILLDQVSRNIHRAARLPSPPTPAPWPWPRIASVAGFIGSCCLHGPCGC